MVNQQWEEPPSNINLASVRGPEEPGELRGSCPALWGPGGEFALGYST